MPRKKTGDFIQSEYIKGYQREFIRYRKMNFNLSKPDDTAILAWIDQQPEGASNYLKSLVLKDMKVRERNMKEYFTMDSFGSDCPANWEAICEFLNKKAAAIIGPDDDEHEAVEKIWEDFCAGDFDNDDDFPGYNKTYADYMRDNPDENLDWCKPYISDDGRYAIAINEGEIIEAITPDGHLPVGHLSPLTEDEIEKLAREIDHDYDLYDGWNDTEIILNKLHETGCSSCPFFGKCDAMQQEMEC